MLPYIGIYEFLIENRRKFFLKKYQEEEKYCQVEKIEN